MADTKENLVCPACGKQMIKVFDEQKGINIDICINGCGGILFDNRELDKFDENVENADIILKEIENKSFQKVDSAETRVCPLCNTPMVKMGAGVAAVEIDYCNVCGAKFLDNGELEKIRLGERQDISDIDEIVTKLYQDDLRDIIGDKNLNTINSSPRRKFFENLVKSYLKK